ncbi:MAG: YncE family protein [Acidimicrobiales bacterium]
MLSSSRFARKAPLGRAAHVCAGLLVGGALVVLALPAWSGGAGAAPSQQPASPVFDSPTSATLVGADLYVANGAGNSVTEVTASHGAPVAAIGGSTFGFDGPTAITSAGTDLFVANGAGNSLTEFTSGTNTFVRQIMGATFDFDDPIALAVQDDDLFVLSAGGSVTEVDTTTGQLVGTASGSQFGFDAPAGIAVAGSDLFVTNGAADSVTEIAVQGLTFVASLSSSSYGFDEPAGIVAVGDNLWVANQGGSVTEFSAINNKIRVVVSGNLPTPQPITAGDGYVFAASPPGGSPMVTQITASTAAVNWMMCNTNGPYLFNNPQALVVAHSYLWVINEGGNSLTQMDAGSGALVRTVS